MSTPITAAGDGVGGSLELAVYEGLAGSVVSSVKEEQLELVAAVDWAPVGAQAHHQLEHQVGGVLPHLHPLGGVGPQPDSAEHRMDGVAGPQVDPVLSGVVVEAGEVVPVPLQAGSDIRVPVGPQLSTVGLPLAGALLSARSCAHPEDGPERLRVQPLG